MYMIKQHLVRFIGAGGVKKGELKNEATPTMLLKTNGGKTSAGATPTMFMKTSNLSLHTYDVDENKGGCSSGSSAGSRRGEIHKSVESDLGDQRGGPGVNHAAAHFPAEREKKMLNDTFEAGMSMKTKDRKTRCPNRNRLIVPRFRHFRRIEWYFAEKCCISTTVCQVNSVCCRFFRARYDLPAKLAPARTEKH